ncbi:30389_t:CDS:2, partial [Gigaspora margarita]
MENKALNILANAQIKKGHRNKQNRLPECSNRERGQGGLRKRYTNINGNNNDEGRKKL